ncbi:MAG: hypothetical protein SO152_05410 [Ruminococcus sp.]|nr:hypothetical protein [Ruminococcus sp.]
MISILICVGYYAYFFYAKNYYKNEISYYKNQPSTPFKVKKLAVLSLVLIVLFTLIVIISSVNMLLILNFIPAIFCLMYLKVLNIRINRLKKKGG